MANHTKTSAAAEVDYPDSDGRPMAETPRHRQVMTDVIDMLETWFADDDQVYVSGNMFVYYVPGDRLKHVSPDVFVSRDVPKVRIPDRRRYLVWEEGKGPACVIEISSESTREEDFDDKFHLYQSVLRVREYFLFDPYGEYLDPPLQGYRLRRGKYVPIEEVDGRLPSEVLGLHLEAHGVDLRLYDPTSGQYLQTPKEVRAAQKRAEVERRREATARRRAEAQAERAEAERRRAQAEREHAEAEREHAEAERERAEAEREHAEAEREREVAARQRAEAEVERLRQELKSLKRKPRSD